MKITNQVLYELMQDKFASGEKRFDKIDLHFEKLNGSVATNGKKIVKLETKQKFIWAIGGLLGSGIVALVVKIW